jgi:hypothetical protein
MTISSQAGLYQCAGWNVTDNPNMPFAEVETEKKKRGWPAGRPRGGGPAPTTQIVRPIDQQDIRLGAQALLEDLAAAERGNGRLDIFATIVRIYQQADMISPRAPANSPNKPKEKADGTLTCEIPPAPNGNAEGREAPGPS